MPNTSKTTPKLPAYSIWPKRRWFRTEAGKLAPEPVDKSTLSEREEFEAAHPSWAFLTSIGAS